MWAATGPTAKTLTCKVNRRPGPGSAALPCKRKKAPLFSALYRVPSRHVFLYSTFMGARPDASIPGRLCALCASVPSVINVFRSCPLSDPKRLLCLGVIRPVLASYIAHPSARAMAPDAHRSHSRPPSWSARFRKSFGSNSYLISSAKSFRSNSYVEFPRGRGDIQVQKQNPRLRSCKSTCAPNCQLLTVDC
jgi:hypothetical protein